MLTPSDTFNELIIRPNISGRLILHISAESPSTDFYFSDVDFRLNSTMIYGLVKSWGKLTSKINIFSKQSRVSNVSVKLVNDYYKAPGGALKSISEMLDATKYINRTASIYIWLEGITQLSDCLKIFEGIVQPPKDVTPELMTLPIIDSTFLKHKMIPQTLINKTDFEDAPEDSIGKPIPIVYGNHKKNDEIKGPVSKCHWIASNKVVASDVPAKSISAVWIWDDKLNDFAKIDSSQYTITLDDDGISTIEFNDISNVICWAYLYPDKYIDYDDNQESVPDVMFYIEDINKSYDKKATTYLGIYRCRDYNTCYIHCHFKNNLNALGNISQGVSGRQFLEAKSYDDGNLTLANIRIYNTATSTYSSNLDLEDADHTSAYASLDVSGYFDTYYVYCNWESLATVLCINPQGVTDDVVHVIGWKLYEIRLRTRYEDVVLNEDIEVFVECEGRQFGSWIDEGGRSNSYNEGDVIEHPAFIIEDILRRELGFASGDIDVASFDAMASEISSWILAINLLEQLNSLTLIEQICKQSISNYYMDSQGKAKVIVFKSSYSEDATLYETQIRKGKFKVSKSTINDLINSLRLNYNLCRGSGMYRDYIETDNSTSQSDYNITKELEINADMIFALAVADDLKDHFVGTSGFWKDLKTVVEFEANTWELAHWDIGDIIKTDSSLNNIVKNFSSAWTDSKFMIIEKKMNPYGPAFKMVDVTTGGGAPE